MHHRASGRDERRGAIPLPAALAAIWGGGLALLLATIAAPPLGSAAGDASNRMSVTPPALLGPGLSGPGAAARVARVYGWTPADLEERAVFVCTGSRSLGHVVELWVDGDAAPRVVGLAVAPPSEPRGCGEAGSGSGGPEPVSLGIDDYQALAGAESVRMLVADLPERAPVTVALLAETH